MTAKGGRKPPTRQEISAGREVGVRLRHYREIRGFSQEKLAKLAKTTKAHVNRIENGLVLRPGRGLLQRLADALTVPFQSLAEPLGWGPSVSKRDTWSVIEETIMTDPNMTNEHKRGLIVSLKPLFPPRESG
jgi:transcriptional regulator with XRE-family HTH domain